MLVLLSTLLACSGSNINTGDDSGGDGNGGSHLTAPPIVINEFLAMNATTLADNAGEFDDYIELYNTGTSIVQFDGLYLSDHADSPLKWALPAGRGIDAGGYAIFWADDDDGIGTDSGSAVSQGDDHTSFQLNGNGEAVILTYASGGDQVRVDAIEYGTQQPDISGQRVPDGSLNWDYAAPTPNATNGN
jgi:hypothetical protein